MMAIDAKQMEMDRIVNMARSFGWAVVKTEMIDDRVVVTLEKKVTPPVAK